MTSLDSKENSDVVGDPPDNLRTLTLTARSCNSPAWYHGFSQLTFKTEV